MDLKRFRGPTKSQMSIPAYPVTQAANKLSYCVKEKIPLNINKSEAVVFVMCDPSMNEL